MNAKKLKEAYKNKLPLIAKTIASFMDKNKKEIEEKILNAPLYIYEDSYSQKERLEKIDIANYAREFALDVLDAKNLTIEDNQDLLDDIALYAAKQCFNDYIDKKGARDIVVKYKVLHESIVTSEDLIIDVAKHTRDDYQVKELLSEYYISKNKHDYIENKDYQIKQELFEDYFNLYIDKKDKLDQAWQYLNSFSTSNEKLAINNSDYANKLLSAQVKFYQLLGCNGKTLKDLVNDAKNKKVYLNGMLVDCIIGQYTKKLCDDCLDTLKDCTNISQIFNDLETKGYSSIRAVELFTILNNSNYFAVNMQAKNEKNKLSNYILIINNYVMNSKIFTETCIHELLHYIGGECLLYNKKGLYYNSDLKYLDLEEAYVNYMAKKITKEFRSKYGDIIDNPKEIDMDVKYDSTLPYIKELENTYLPILKRIHLDNLLSISDANKMMPFDEIANSVSRILRSNKEDSKRVCLEEIKTISKLRKNNKK